MKNILFYSLLLFSLLQSCGSSSNVTSNFSIQKRKYTKGWNVKDLIQQRQRSEETLTQKPDEESLKIEDIEVKSNYKKVEIVSNSISNSTNESISVKDINSEATYTVDKLETDNENSLLNKKSEVENVKVIEDNQFDNMPSPELIKFNKYHKTMVILLFGALITFLISLFPLYVMLIIQRFKNVKAVPMEERDEYYYRKKIFAGVFFILGTILLTIFLTGLVAGLIFL